MDVYCTNNLRIIDLTKKLYPSTEQRRLELKRFNTGGPIPDFHTHMDITSHLGTHVECPYHHRDEWKDVLHMPLTSFMGRGVYAPIEHMNPNEHITGADLELVCGDIIGEDDVLIIDSPYKLKPFTEKTNTEEDKRLFIGKDACEWLLKRKIRCLGFGDGVSIENCNEDCSTLHDLLLGNDIVFIEVLENLELLQKRTFFISYSPLPIEGLDSCPVRVYAIEGMPGF